MKRHILILISFVVVLASISTHQMTALGESISNAIVGKEEALSFSNQPADHRYRLILDHADESTILAIAEESRMKKKDLIRMLASTAKRYDLEPALIVAIATQESMLDPKARSHMGAMGLMQLMPATARRFGVRNIFDPKQNAEGGTRYFRFLLNEFNGKTELALAAYNAGSAPVIQYQAVPPFGQTQTFVERVLRLRDHYRQVLE